MEENKLNKILDEIQTNLDMLLNKFYSDEDLVEQINTLSANIRTIQTNLNNLTQTQTGHETSINTLQSSLNSLIERITLLENLPQTDTTEI